MNSDIDLLRRSMDAAPEEWLDRLVADRVMVEVRQGPRTSNVHVLRAMVTPLRALLARLLPPSAQPLLWHDGDQEG